MGCPSQRRLHLSTQVSDVFEILEVEMNILKPKAGAGVEGTTMNHVVLDE